MTNTMHWAVSIGLCIVQRTRATFVKLHRPKHCASLDVTVPGLGHTGQSLDVCGGQSAVHQACMILRIYSKRFRVHSARISPCELQTKELCNYCCRCPSSASCDLSSWDLMRSGEYCSSGCRGSWRARWFHTAGKATADAAHTPTRALATCQVAVQPRLWCSSWPPSSAPTPAPTPK
eukprot:213604-Chlamydomonas_euryale.AAC.44